MRSSVIRDVKDNTIIEIKSFIIDNNLDMNKYESLEKFITNIEEVDCCVVKQDISSSKELIETDLNTEAKSFETQSMIDLIPRSPHLSREFSDTGERIRDSFRARRRRKILNKKRLSEEKSDLDNASHIEYSNNTILCDTSESEPLSLIEITNDANQQLQNVEKTLNEVSETLMYQSLKANRTNVYGKEAFLIKLNDGILSINNVKNIENVSDFDSSCDTSLNYIDNNTLGANTSFILSFNENVIDTPILKNNICHNVDKISPHSAVIGKKNEKYFKQSKSISYPSNKIRLSENRLKNKVKDFSVGKRVIQNETSPNHILKKTLNKETHNPKTFDTQQEKTSKVRLDPKTHLMLLKNQDKKKTQKCIETKILPNTVIIEQKINFPSEDKTRKLSHIKEHIANRTTESTRAKSKMKPISMNNQNKKRQNAVESTTIPILSTSIIRNLSTQIRKTQSEK